VTRVNDSTRVAIFADSDSTQVTLRKMETRLESGFLQNDSTRAGPSPAGVTPPFEVGAPQFHVWPPGYCIHLKLCFKDVAPPSSFWPSIWFLAPPAAKSWRRARTRVTVNDSRLASESFLQNLWVPDGQTQFVCTQRNEHFSLKWSLLSSRCNLNMKLLRLQYIVKKSRQWLGKE